MIALAAVAVFCMVGLPAAANTTDLPGAVVTAEQRDAAAAAQVVADQIVSATRDLADAVPAAPGDAGDVVAALPPSAGWRGVLVVDRATGTVRGASGEPVPRDAVPAPGVEGGATVRSVPGGTRIVVTRAIGRGRELVVATREMAAPNPSPTTAASPVGTYLVGPDGGLLATFGSDVDRLRPAERALVLRHATSAGRGATGVAAADLSTADDATLSALVAYHPVTLDRREQPGPAVLTLSAVAGGADDAPDGVVFGLALLLIAAVGAVVLHCSVVRPIRRLRADALAVASGELDAEVHVSRLREPRRVAVALRRCAAHLRVDGSDAPPRSRSVPAMVVVIALAASMVGWAGVLWQASRCDGADIPVSALAQSRDASSTAALALEQTLLRGRADLEALALAPAPNGPVPLMTDLSVRQPGYRNVYLVGRTGEAVSVAGRGPLRPARPLAPGAGIVQDNTDGPMPIVFAYATLPHADAALVAEFDIPFLIQQLRMPPGKGRVLDAGMRTVLAGGGFRAFTTESDPAVERSVERAQGDRPTTTIEDVDGVPTLLSADAVVAGSVRWTVVVDQPTSVLDMRASPANRGAEVAALVAAFLAVVLVGWTYVTTVRPLRRLVEAAEGVVAGDVHAVVYPERHDEIGTIAGCVELCRQALSEGVHRLGARATRRGIWRPDATGSITTTTTTHGG